MQIFDISISELKEYEHNPRNNDDAVDAVAESIKEFGFKVPIVVDKNNVIVAGHTRLKAAKKLGMDKVPCIVAKDLSEEQIKAFRLADNKTGELAEWDFELLEQELEELTAFDVDMSLFGFDASLFDDLEEQEVKEDDFDTDAELEKIIIPTTKQGEVWKLGEHRLICGDSTVAATVETLLQGNKADLVVTDPPYNVNYQGTAGQIENDNMSSEEFGEFLTKAFTGIHDALKEGAAFYVWFATREHVNFEVALNSVGLKVRQELIWVKNSMTLGRQDYQWRHEPCLYGWKDGASHNWYSDRSQTTILEFDKPTKNIEHPTMKPLELIGYQVGNSSKKRDIVLDVFGGSGSTLIACEQLGRVCYMSELDPKYCDVIIKRWEALTGETAILEK